MKRPLSEKLTEETIKSLSGSVSDPRQIFLLRQTLQSLIRLAKAEQMSLLRHDVEKATQAQDRRQSQRQAKQLIDRVSGHQLPCMGNRRATSQP